MLRYFGTLTKFGLITNGTLPSFKLTKIGVQYVSLSNTCSFNASAQIFASSYCDSTNYREEINKLNINTAILEVAQELAT